MNICIDHWPPTYDDISDAFVSIEKHLQRVEHIHLYQSDLPPNEPHTLDQNGNNLWGAKLHFLSGVSKGTMWFKGGTLETALLGPRA